MSTRRTVGGLFAKRFLPLQKALSSAAPASRERPPDVPASIPKHTAATNVYNPLSWATLESRTDAPTNRDREVREVPNGPFLGNIQSGSGHYYGLPAKKLCIVERL